MLETKYVNFGIILRGGLNWFFFLKSTKIIQISRNILVIVPLGLGNETCKFWNHTKGWTKMCFFLEPTEMVHNQSTFR